MLLKERIARHYDDLSPFYKDIWGVHIHHGYWKTGTERKDEAQVQLIRELVARADLKPGCRILDVGCGLGGSAIALSKLLDAHVTGITISQAQVEIGSALVRQSGADVRLLCMDAEALTLEDRFDVVWSVEAISHLHNRRACFRSFGQVLNDGGRMVIADWLRSPTLTADQERRFLEPVERAMLVPKLETSHAYADHIRQAGLTVTLFEDFSQRVSKTWDIAIELIRSPAVWKLAATRGKDAVAFLEGFAAMRAGYKSRALVYGVLAATKP